MSFFYLFLIRRCIYKKQKCQWNVNGMYNPSIHFPPLMYNAKYKKYIIVKNKLHLQNALISNTPQSEKTKTRTQKKREKNS